MAQPIRGPYIGFDVNVPIRKSDWREGSTYADRVLNTFAADDELLAIIDCDVPNWNAHPTNPTLIHAPHPFPNIDPIIVPTDDAIAAEEQRLQYEREQHARFLITHRSRAHLLAITEAERQAEANQQALLHKARLAHQRELREKREAKKQRERSERMHAKRTTITRLRTVYCPKGNHNYMRGGPRTMNTQHCPRCLEVIK